MRTIVAALAALSLGATPALAAPQSPARSLSVAGAARTSAPAPRRAKLAAPGGAITIVLIAAAVIGGVVLITNSDGDDSDSN